MLGKEQTLKKNLESKSRKEEGRKSYRENFSGLLQNQEHQIKDSTIDTKISVQPLILDVVTEDTEKLSNLSSITISQ